MTVHIKLADDDAGSVQVSDTPGDEPRLRLQVFDWAGHSVAHLTPHEADRLHYALGAWLSQHGGAA